MILAENIALSVRELSKSFYDQGKEIKALDSISFDLKKGEMLGLIGANGAGKSTLLKILSRITAPDKGEAFYEGTLTSIIEIGTGFHADLSGKENVYLNASLLGMTRKEIDSIYSDIVDFSGLEEFMKMPVKKYSSGMYLRLAFSIAFFSKIEILLLDEVMAVGDAKFRNKCYHKIQELKKSGKSILLVSHNMETIIEHCDSCIYLEKGRIQDVNDPLTCVEKYLKQSAHLSTDSQIQTLSENGTVDLNYTLAGLTIKNIEVSNGKDGGVLSPNEDIEFKILIHNKEKSSFEIILFITNIHGQKVLMDSYGLRKDYKSEEAINSDYMVSCTIYKNLLSSGIYKLGLAVCRNEVLIDEQSSLFNVQIGEIYGKDEFDRKMGSIVRPQLEWEIKRIL